MNNSRRKVFLSLIIFAFYNCSVYAASDSSGWTIFNRIESSQFRALSVTSPGYSNLAGVLYNPAMAGTLSSKQLLFISELGFADDKLGAALVGIPVGKGMLSIGGGYYDAGSVDLNWIGNDGGLNTENVSLESDTLGLLSYEHPILSNLYAGMTLKGATSNIAQRSTASAVAGDIGIFYLPFPNLTVSLAMQNIGSSTKFIDQSNPLPTSNYIGMGYVWNNGNFYVLTGAGVTNNIQDNTQFPEAGVEIGIGNISMNLGYRFNDDETNFHTGIQFVIKNIVIGYAYLPGVYLGPTQSLTIGYRFPAAKKMPPKHKTVPAPPKFQPPRYQLRMPMDMAVARFSAVGLPQLTASYISDSLREELIKIGKFDVVDRPDMERTLEPQYFNQQGCSELDCAIELGRILNVKQTIIGSLTKVEGGYSLKVNIINIKSGKVTHTFTKQADSLKGLKAACATFAKQIFKSWLKDKNIPTTRTKLH